jgi:ribosome-associated protein
MMTAKSTNATMSDSDFISKSQKKRDMHELQAVGEQLIALSRDYLKAIKLPENLLSAVLEAKDIPVSKHTARKRQRQYVGRLMRDVDVAPIIEQLNALQAPSRKQTALLHLAEQWRERLLKDDGALDALIGEFPRAENLEIREMIAVARDETAHDKPPKHFRELYHVIHALIQEKTRGQKNEHWNS